VSNPLNTFVSYSLYSLQNGLITTINDINTTTFAIGAAQANQDFYLGDINWATVRDLNKRWLDKTEYRINKKAVQESSTNIIPSGNVVIATRVG
jgi:type I restriction enzyme S subunit